MVDVICDDTYFGCYDSYSFGFPINLLSKTDKELEEIVIMEKELNIEIERKKQEEKLLKEQREKEQREFEQYQKLKTKYENTNNGI